jgi:hypothetical protein
VPREAGGGPTAELEIGTVPRLRRGEVLVVAPAVALAIRAADTELRMVSGAARASQVLGNVVVATYLGRLTVSSAGRRREVPALRQTTIVAAGLLPARPSPLHYDARDPFDRRYLGDAIALGEELDARVRGLTANLRLGPDEGRTPGFYRELLPALERERALPALLDELDGSAAFAGAPVLAPPEKLVGAAIATQSRRGRFASRWRATFAFRRAGAQWGIVALDQRVRRAPLLREIDLALGRRNLTPIASPAVAPSTATSLPVSPGTTAPAPTAPPRVPSGGAPPTTAPPVAPVQVPPVPLAPAQPIIDAVNDLLRGLL